jgi:hypothetical protein
MPLTFCKGVQMFAHDDITWAVGGKNVTAERKPLNNVHKTWTRTGVQFVGNLSPTKVLF